jgi:hypothetical protein
MSIRIEGGFKLDENLGPRNETETRGSGRRTYQEIAPRASARDHVGGVGAHLRIPRPTGIAGFRRWRERKTINEASTAGSSRMASHAL